MDSQEKWNLKYKDRLTKKIQPEPNTRLLMQSGYLNGGEALDIACGLGGNSYYLAEIGYEVTAIDISDVAVDYVQEQAAGKKLNITVKNADLTKETPVLTGRKYELAVLTYYLDRSLFPLMKEVIKADGYLFMETFFQNGASGNQNVSNRYKLESNELLKEFGDWRVLYFEENEQEGRQTIFCQNQR
ncbi:methyltransferase domain-containing protein [Bacillus sp. ISL-35]|uniref:class I SAM-dependent methyltransferase n=1 Tax=Bacillus sp. ISL-35 TaxID=2819122 RepID=UPI001BE759C0|nr:class I SAM-dependent methyltransferase [Bacillus sp. ISL-35]MBT2679547.1 methyltransferase domain-containing protein [Bacillus sp. ISL-35]MBT2703450.1 methyltransferase domain-containing protein [Chryseobacterium sp. ISL-80]